MKERPMTFPEITTSDIGCALYLLGTKQCQLTHITYVNGRGVKNRFRMTLTGMNTQLFDAQYFTSLEQEIDFTKLPELFTTLTKLLPKMSVVSRKKVDQPEAGGVV